MIAALVLSALLAAAGERTPVHFRDMSSWPRSDVRALAAGVEKALAAPQLRGAHAGIAIVDPATSEIAYQRDFDGAFIPASALKLVVAAAALDVLGPQFRAHTDVFAAGDIAPGLLIGDLYLRGGGAPLLLERDLASAAEAVVNAGVTRISGRMFYDASRFDARGYGAGWAVQDIPRFFSAPISALSVDENVLPLLISPTAVGERARVTPLVNQSDVSVTSDLFTVGTNSEESFDCARSPGSAQIRVIGTIRIDNPGAQLGCAVVDGAHYAASAFAAALAVRGVQLSPQLAPRAVPAGATLLWRREGNTVAELLPKMLQPSDNFIADVLLKQLAVQQGRVGSFAEGVAAVVEFAEAVGAEPFALSLADGSGLSPDDRITPRALATVLAYEAQSGSAETFRNALPVGGISGTLADRFLASPARGSVYAKAGTLPHVSTLAGYARTKHHGLIAFVVMFNDFMRANPRPLLNAEELIAEALVAL